MSNKLNQSTHYNIGIKNKGLQPYEQTLVEMQSFTANRDETTTDEIWLVEHSPVFTQGQAGKPEHILDPGDIQVIRSDRGGQVTYHGPGQVVAYLLLDLRRRKIGVRECVDLIENAVISLLADAGITAEARADAPGVYVGPAKIASLGLRIKHGCSYHGVALNVAMDLSPFSRINPCGFAGMSVTQLSDLGVSTSPADAAQLLAESLCTQIGSSDNTAKKTASHS